jgi:hypothetical protein
MQLFTNLLLAITKLFLAKKLENGCGGQQFDGLPCLMRPSLLINQHYKTAVPGGGFSMENKKENFVTQEETGEAAPIDEVEGRVEAEMKRIEGRAKERVGQGLQDEELEHEGRELKEEGEREKQG